MIWVRNASKSNFVTPKEPQNSNLFFENSGQFVNRNAIKRGFKGFVKPHGFENFAVKLDRHGHFQKDTELVVK